DGVRGRHAGCDGGARAGRGAPELVPGEAGLLQGAGVDPLHRRAPHHRNTEDPEEPDLPARRGSPAPPCHPRSPRGEEAAAGGDPGQALRVNFWKGWQASRAGPPLTAKGPGASGPEIAARESTARPCGAAKLPGASALGVPHRASTRPSLSSTLTRPYFDSAVGPWRCEV